MLRRPLVIMDPRPPEDVHLGEEPIPLQNSWTVWHDRYTGSGNKTLADYEAKLQEICKYETVQRFWECFNNLPTPDKLSVRCSLHMMVTGIKPLWEDPRNEKGGCWTIRIAKKDTVEAWKEIVLAAIGEQFAPVLDEGDDINGVSVSIREYHDLIWIWNKKANDAGTMKIFNRVKKLIEKVEIITYYYAPCQSHDAFGRK